MIDLGELQGTVTLDGVDSATDSIGGLQQKFSGALNGLKSFVAGAIAIKGVKVAFDATIGAANELKQASNTLQTQTGATNEEMTELNSTMKDIYASNFGENFDDIAESLATVQQQTGATGEELKGLTTNALAMRDTFDMDVTESIRTAEMMMTQFGVSGDEAYSLIAQGAQNGLDKNDNLLDSINEYSVHFKQLGFDADDMFNMFSNGAESGVFDVDKLG